MTIVTSVSSGVTSTKMKTFISNKEMMTIVTTVSSSETMITLKTTISNRETIAGNKTYQPHRLLLRLVSSCWINILLYQAEGHVTFTYC